MGALTRTVVLVLAGLALGACATTQGASPELASAFAFAAYPNARLLETQVYPDTLVVFQAPGRSGTQLYETSDTHAQVEAYYRKLAADKQWTFTSAGTDRSALDFVTLQRDRFDIRIGDDYAMGYPAPSPTPSEGASPLPAPSPTPWRLRVSVIVAN